MGVVDAGQAFDEMCPPRDPLVDDLRLLGVFLGWGCTCGAPAEALHTNNCGITPIYASLVTSGYQMLIGSFHAATASMPQTVIKCAECGREMLGRDAIIVRTPGSPFDMARQENSTKRIVKAVCRHHNRKGNVGYQRQAWAGY